MTGRMDALTRFDARLGPLTVERFLGKGKSGRSYQVRSPAGPLVLKVAHDEVVPYYRFTRNEVELEVEAYGRLRALGVRVPELVESDVARGYLLKRYVDGPTVSEATAAGRLPESAVAEAFAMARVLRAAGLNTDWFPSNFVLGPEGLTLIDYELNPYMEEWGLEAWGLWYWANTEGMRAFLARGDVLAINVSAESGKPRREGLEARVAGWCRAFGVG